MPPHFRHFRLAAPHYANPLLLMRISFFVYIFLIYAHFSGIQLAHNTRRPWCPTAWRKIILTDHCTDSVTLCTRGLLEKLTVSQLVKKFPAFYGTRRFITTFTRARHLSPSQASSVQDHYTGTLKIQCEMWYHPCFELFDVLCIPNRQAGVFHLWLNLCSESSYKN
jgi:hypothetical protein